MINVALWDLWVDGERRMPGESNQRDELTIGGFTLISLIALLLITLVSLSPVWLFTLYLSDFLLCIAIGWDFGRRFIKAARKSTFWKYHGYEVLSFIPALIFYPTGQYVGISIILRSLRLIRVIYTIAPTNRVVKAALNFVIRSHSI